MPLRPPLLSEAARTGIQVAAITKSCASASCSLLRATTDHARLAHILATLRDNPGAHQKRIRLGRGPSSGKGKTSGRGQKGQKQHGHVHPWFQGGQTPLIRVRGQMGFTNLHKLDMTEINLDRIQKFIDDGRLDPHKQITPKELWESRLVTRLRDGIKLLARGKEDLKTSIDIMVSRASARAIEAVEAAGGKIVTRYYTKDSMSRLIRGEAINSEKPLPVGEKHVPRILEKMKSMDKHYARLPDPTSRRDFEYYRDPAHRGYMRHLIKPGYSPSLFYKVPPKVRKKFDDARDGGKAKLAGGSVVRQRVNTRRLW